MTRTRRALALFLLLVSTTDLSHAAAREPPTADEVRLLLAQGNYVQAEARARELLARVEAAHGVESVEAAEVLDLLVEALRRTGGTRSGARELAERAVEVKERILGPDHIDLATSLLALGNFLFYQDLHAEAKARMERALRIREATLGPDHPAVAECHEALGRWNRAEHEYAAAKAHFERAVAIQERAFGTDSALYAESLSKLGATLREMGSREGQLLLERGCAILERKPSGALTGCLYTLGRTLVDGGRYADAKIRFEQALAVAESTFGSESPTVTQIWADQAALLALMGSYAEALSLVDRALAVQEKELGPEYSSVLRAIQLKAMLLLAMDRPAEARPLMERAVAALEQTYGRDHPKLASAWGDLAGVLLEAGDEQEALRAALLAEEIGSGFVRHIARAFDEQRALSYAAEGMFASKRHLGLALALEIGTRTGLSNEARRTIWDALIRSRSLVLDEVAVRRRSASEVPEAARRAAELAAAGERLADLVVRGPRGEAPGRYGEMVEAARKERERAEEALAEVSVTFRAELKQAEWGLDDVARQLPERTALVAYVLAEPALEQGDYFSPVHVPPAYFVLVLAGVREEPALIRLGARDDIDALVAQWRREAGAEPPDPESESRPASMRYREAARELRRAIWDPPASLVVEGTRRVFVVADGALNLVSFASLPDGESGYLVERAPVIHYLSTERDIVRGTGPRATGRGLLALGGPAYDESSLFAALSPVETEAGAEPLASPDSPLAPVAGRVPSVNERSACSSFQSMRFDPLPGAELEARQLVQLWREAGGAEPGSDAVLFSGAAATEAGFKRHASQSRVVHLATHGFFLGARCASILDGSRGIGKIAMEPDAPPAVAGENPLLLSGLALAGANHRDAAGPDEEDGILTAEEIAALDLSGVEWAVLSACDTGLGDIKAGEGVFGLRRAFQVAGARALIMSLWAVEDESARAWMRALYEARLVKRMDTAEAVREASLTVLRDRRERGESTHPFHWAGFVAAGDWR